MLNISTKKVKINNKKSFCENFALEKGKNLEKNIAFISISSESENDEPDSPSKLYKHMEVK